jgi:hypothetical protein
MANRFQWPFTTLGEPPKRGAVRQRITVPPVRTVARLEGRRWVTRKPDPSDGRYTLATLTAAGRAVLVEAAPGHVETVRRLDLHEDRPDIKAAAAGQTA